LNLIHPRLIKVNSKWKECSSFRVNLAFPDATLRI
jgi:hypothetical protein